MRIVIPAEDKNMDSGVCPSFGRTPYFLVYNTDEEKAEFIENPASKATGGAGVLAAQEVVDLNPEILLTPRCGENAGKVLKGADIKIYKSINKTLKENIEEFKKEGLSELESFHKGFHGGHN